MSHVRQQLVTAVVARLTGLATTGSRVFDDRPAEHALQESELPALLVYDDGDEIDADSLTHDTRRTRLRVSIAGKAVSGLAAQQRQIAAEVETALGTPLTVGSTLVPVEYRGAEPDEDAGSDRPVRRLTLNYEAILFTAIGAPETLA